MHLSAQYALQCLTTVEAVGVEKDVAVGITPTSPSLRRRHLCPFALHWALPSSLVGRDSHDYYEPSVALALASGRRSHIPSTLDVSSLT
jgi:hypothetical protein